MDISKILRQIDNLYANKEIDKVESYVETYIREAMDEGDTSSLITLINEMIGYQRDSGHYETAVEYSNQVLKLMNNLGLTDSIEYGTTLINVANAYRAANRLDEAQTYFEQVFKVYRDRIEDKDLLYASLYNNMSLMYQEKGDFSKAVECLRHALAIVKEHPDDKIKLAITYGNLGESLIKIGALDEAMEVLNKAYDIYKVDEVKDFHYSGTIAAMAEIYFLNQDYEHSAALYEETLKELLVNVGHTSAYDIIKGNLDKVYEAMGRKSEISGLLLSKEYYKEYGKPMLEEQFKDYVDRIAVGLVGEGSECFGLDDEYSRDHDFGPGFIMWVTKEDYAIIGEELKKAYNTLPKEYKGFKRNETNYGVGRMGVWVIEEFFAKILLTDTIPESEESFALIDENRLAMAVNGEVFKDDLGIFTAIRDRLMCYYPDKLWRQKIAGEAIYMSQLGQYNYKRMLKRGEKVTANIILGKYLEHTMHMVYLLNRIYEPYYKWAHVYMRKLPILPEVGDIMEAINDMPKYDERIPLVIDMIADLIVDELNRQGLSKGKDNYLESHASVILGQELKGGDIVINKDGEMHGKEDKTLCNEDGALCKEDVTQFKEVKSYINEEKTISKEELVNVLIDLEWKAFDKVENQGGRANCQDDLNTFTIMRKSQYLTWNEDMLISYIDDFNRANSRGWNLITEKYGRMMESTAPDQYDEIKASFPVIDEAKKAIIEEIVDIQVKWMEEFAKSFPKAAGNARSIHTSEDNLYNTSYETYLRGEISTYSDRTLGLYGGFIVNLCNEEKNLAYMTMSNTAILYGYESVEDLENRL